MAEAMINEEHRGSVPDLQAVNKETNDGSTSRPKRKSGDAPSKTVVIKLPPKRRKVSSGFAIKDVGKMISLSLTSADREVAISKASTCFDHNEQAVHDQEILFGIDAVLTKHLGYLLCRRDCQPLGARQEITREIASTCKTLEMVYRGSVNNVAESFKRNGEEVMTILLKAIDYELCHRLSIVEASTEVQGSIEESDQKKPPTTDTNVTNDEEDKDETTNDDDGQTTGYCEIGVDQSPEGDMTLCKATKTLGHFARVETATQPMATHEGLLSVLITLMTAEPYYAIPAEARLNSIWIIANLACNTDNMVMMACHPELLVSLIIIAARTVVKTTPPAQVIEILRAQSIAVRALLNLSWAPENRIPMSENTHLVQVLSNLTIFRQSPKRGRTLAEIILQTRRQAVGTLRNLAAAPRRNKIFLCNLKNGLLLNVLTDAVLNDVDEGVKKRAFATINNLAVHDTAPMMVEHPALVLVLKNSLQDEVLAADDDLKASAHGTLLVLERSITPDMDCYQNLRELLDAVNPTTDNESEEAATAGEDAEQTSA